MKTQFDILISFRTPSGFKTAGQYFLGSDARFAESVFAGLAGRHDADDKAVLHLDLLESSGEIPVRVKTISCKLSELSSNCRHITRELFRVNAIDAGKPGANTGR